MNQDIEDTIRSIRDDVDTRNYLLLLYYDMKERITKINYEIECGKAKVSDIFELYTLKRKMSSFIRNPSFKYKYILRLMLEEIESVINKVNNTLDRLDYTTIKKIVDLLNQSYV